MNFPRLITQFALAAAVVALVAVYVAAAPQTRGHEADFGKQWIAARLVASGQCRNLYDHETQRAELAKHFHPEVIQKIWREGVGATTYPPTLAVFYAPLGWLSPHGAQIVIVELSTALVLAAAFVISRITGGRIRWAVAVLAILTLPSFALAVGLGQNSALSLLIFATGWWLLARGRSILGGLVWGFFALKPTLGIGVAALPAIVGQPLAYGGMLASSAALIGLTLSFCGLRPWVEWLQVARLTERLYETLPRWRYLSRDLPGLFRRLDQGAEVELLGIAAILLVLVVTVWAWRRRRNGTGATGVGVVVLLAGAILLMPRFMYYDVTLAVVPALVALSFWGTLAPFSRLVLLLLLALIWIGSGYSFVRWYMFGPPLETFGLVGLWLWAVVESRRQRRRGSAVAVDAPASAG